MELELEQNLLEHAKQQLRDKKDLNLIKETLILYVRQEHFKAWEKLEVEPCSSCITFLNDEELNTSCPACNGKGFLKPSFSPLSEEEINKKVENLLHKFEEYKYYLKKQKNQELNELNISIYGTSLNADMEALGNMGIVIGGKCFEMLEKFAEVNAEFKPIFEEFKNQELEWKNFQNGKSSLKVGTIATALKKAMLEKQTILFKYKED